MLKSVEIRNFRSCIDVRLDDIGLVLALVGQNGAGKSNILKAIAWAAASTSVGTVGLFSAIHSTEVLPSVELIFEIEGKLLSYRVAIEYEGHAPAQGASSGRFNLAQWLTILDSPDSLIFSLSKKTLKIRDAGSVTEVEVGDNANGFISIPALFPNSSHIQTISEVAKFLRGVHYYPFEHQSSTDPIISDAEYSTWKNSKDKSNISEVCLILLDLWKKEPEKFIELNELVGSNGINVIENISVQELKIPATPEAAPQSFYFINFVPVGMSKIRQIRYDDLSYGTKRILRLLSSLLYDDSTVSLIEQPEDGIHTALVRKLLPLLKSYADPAQFLLATHSATILNRLEPEEVRLVRMIGGSTLIHAMTPSEIDQARRFIEEDGPLADFVRVLGGD